MNTTYKFPYYGSGEVIYKYDEPFFLHVFLKKELTEDQEALVLKSAPAAGEVVFLGNQIDLFDDVNIHADISKGYKTTDGVYLQDDNDWECFECANSQLQAFNLDIERWLIEVNKICSIHLAFNDVGHGIEHRHQVINYSNWHQWSLQQYKTVLSFFKTEIDNGYDEFSQEGHIVQQILIQVASNQRLEEKYIRFLNPGKIEFEAFEKGDVKPLKSITNPSYAEKVIKFFTKNLKEEHTAYLNKHADVLLGFEAMVIEWVFKELIKVLFTHFDTIESPIFKNIASHLTHWHVASALAEKGYNLINKREYRAAHKLFTKLLFVAAEPSVESGFYTNLLWVLQNDNSGIPINKELNQLALQKSLPKGEEYPAIFFNACFLYAEMEEYDKAYHMIELALANYFDPKSMLEQIASQAPCKAFREKTDVIHLLENYKIESEINPEPRLISSAVAFQLYNYATIKNVSGTWANFSTIILVNGHVETEEEFNDMYYRLVPKVDKTKSSDKTLVMVNGNLEAKSMSQYHNEYVVVMGKIICDAIAQKEFIEVGETNFEYVIEKGKKYFEE